MVLHMTQTMLDLVGAAIGRLDDEHSWAELEGMRGYFVARDGSTVPASVAVIAIVKKREAKFMVCVRIVEMLDALDENEWQTPWDAEKSR